MSKVSPFFEILFSVGHPGAALGYGLHCFSLLSDSP